ncbi:hypothetical protein [Candidatus Mesenet endosymbiont of Agriotes lineatus]|uniref:hypothetical protein n=1 Tax=Candidatus Mesenet endosymbiont of Agriotes lineatus TaxID=3077948 RepID=UPI0030D45343
MNGANNQDDLKISDLDFSDLYQNSHTQLSLADLILKNEENKPIIAAHPYGYNSINELSKRFISQEDKDKINQALNKQNQQDGSAELSKNKAKKQLKELSKNAVKEEFDAMFALVEARKRPVLYIRWIPKSDEIFMATRDNHKGHFVCLYFFHNHNSEKSILIANPNGKAISDECEAEVINSYLEKNGKITIYQSRDYFQFGNTDCGPVALIFLRMLYNMSEKDLFDVLRKSQEKKKEEGNPFDYSSIEFNSFLKEEIERRVGETIEGKTEDYIGQKLRHADYATAKVCKEHNDAIKNGDCTAIALAGILFNQELVKDLPKDQVTLLSKFLLNGKQLLTPNQIQQVEQERKEMLGTKKRKTVSFQTSDEHKSKPHNSTQAYKETEKSEFSKILATTAAFIGAVLLGIAILADIKKEFKIGGIVISSIMLISAVTCFCSERKPKFMIINNGVTPETIPIFQQPTSQK